MGQGLRSVLAGTALGALGPLAATRLLSTWLHGVAVGDPVTFAAVAVSLIGVAALASLLPPSHEGECARGDAGGVRR